MQVNLFKALTKIKTQLEPQNTENSGCLLEQLEHFTTQGLALQHVFLVSLCCSFGGVGGWQ